MAMRIRMKYNPYLCKMNLSILSSKGSEEVIDGNAADEIEEHFGDRFCLEDDGERLLDIILESYRGSQIFPDGVHRMPGTACGLYRPHKSAGKPSS